MGHRGKRIARRPGRFIISLKESVPGGGLFALSQNLMKSPTADSSLKLIQAVRALLQCDELLCVDVSESTRQLIEGVLETAGQVLRAALR